MRIITDNEIRDLHITPTECVEWVKEAFLMKERCVLPPKISIHPQRTDFINTMPCLLPEEYHRFGCKVVSRINGSEPSLKSNLMLFDSSTGDMLAVVECNWITAMRTGAVAALSIETLKNKEAKVFSFIGLGVIGNAVLDCLLATLPKKAYTFRLFRYKNHAEKVIERLSEQYDYVKFEIADTIGQWASGSDVIVSSITDAKGLIVEDLSLFKPGVLVVPVHTRGFQNCDTYFDKVIADDRGHVEGFKYFNDFRQFIEFNNILSGITKGRDNKKEQILVYNIGLGLHDVLFATKIMNKLKSIRGGVFNCISVSYKTAA